MRKKIIAFLCVLLTSTVLFAAEKPSESKIRWNMEYEPKTMDSQKLTDVSAIEMSQVCLEGLTKLGENGKVIPGVAESWSAEGNKWTFKLRKDAKWANGESVTAKDFLFGIKRGLTPDTASEYAYMAYFIKNAKPFNEKKITDFSEVGVKVIDDYTIQYEMEKPVPFFPSIVAGLPFYFPVNEKFYNTVGDKFASSADKILCNGPWMMKEWLHDSKVIFYKNPNYWNAKNIKVEKLEYLMVKDYATASNMYKNNEFDATYISGFELPGFKGSKELVPFPDGSIFYLDFNTKNKFLANKNIRKAIAYAVDRTTLVNKVMKDGSTVALALVPDGFPGKKSTFRKDYGFSYFKDNNVAEAKKLLAKGLKEIGHTGKVEIKFTFDNRETTQKYAQVIQAQLLKNLGISVVLEPVTFQIRLQKMTSKDFDMCWEGWGADYLDPMTYIEVFTSYSENNHSSWSNPEYDKYVETAQNSMDPVVRMDAMANAEKLLMDEMPIAPIDYRVRNVVIKSKIKGYFTIPVSHNVDFYNAFIK